MIFLRRTPWKETSAIVECVNKDVKNLAQCLIRSKIVAVDLGGKARASRAGKSKLAQAVGPSVQLDDYKKSTRVSAMISTSRIPSHASLMTTGTRIAWSLFTRTS